MLTANVIRRVLVLGYVLTILAIIPAAAQFIKQPNAWSGPHGDRDNHVLGDFNGDGMTDLIRIQNDISILSNTDAFVWLSTGTRFSDKAKWGDGLVAFYGESFGAVL